MANHASAQKRQRQTAKRTARNQHIRTTVRTFIKRARAALEKKELKSAETLVQTASKLVDRAVSKGVYARATGSRYISRLTTRLSSLRKAG